MRKQLTKLSAFALLFGALAFGSTVQAEEVKVDANNFPDENLRNVLQDGTADGAGHWEYNEDTDEEYWVSAVKVKSDGNYIETSDIMDLSVTGLYNFTGIDKLTSLETLSLIDCTSSTITISNSNLKSLYMNGNTNPNITVNAAGITTFELYETSTANSVDVSKCSNLSYLYVGYNNKLTSIAAPESVVEFYCNNNNLSTLNVSKLTNLQSLSCGGNKLRKLDVKKNKKLVYLYVYDNKKLKSIDVSKNTKLTYLNITNTAVSSLNIKKNTKLTELSIMGTKIKSLNLSKNKKLQYIYLNSKIKKLNLKKYKNAYIYFEVKRGKTLNLNNYIGKGYKVQYSDSEVKYNKKKGTAKLAKKAEKGCYYSLTLKKGKNYYYIGLYAE